MRHKLTPGQKLWIEVFGVYGLPKLDDDKVLAIVDQLPLRHAQAVRLRFGLDDGRSRTLKEAGQALGLSAERVRQLEAAALNKLREPGQQRLLPRLASYPYID